MNDSREDVEQTLGIGRHRRRFPVWLKLSLTLAVLAAMLWLLVLRPDGGADLAYRTEPVTRGDLSVTVTATGTVEPTNLVEVSSELSGTLREVTVDYNDSVEVGQVMARLDTTKLQAQLAVQEASLIAAEARVGQAQVTLRETFETFERQRKLNERGVISGTSIDTARAALERAEAALQIADAERALAQAQLDMQEADLAKATITAPIAGVVLQRNADPGQIVASALSAPVLFTIAQDLSKMELHVDIDEADIAAVAVGDRAQFTVDAHDDEIFAARIAQIRYAAQTVGGVVSYKAILDIDNSDLRLRPGMTATADIIVDELDGALLVPNAALRFAPPRSAQDDGQSGSGLLGLIMPDQPAPELRGDAAGQNHVWVLRDGTAVQVPVSVGPSNGRYSAILDGDLSRGDQVIVDLAEGA